MVRRSVGLSVIISQKGGFTSLLLSENFFAFFIFYIKSVDGLRYELYPWQTLGLFTDLSLFIIENHYRDIGLKLEIPATQNYTSSKDKIMKRVFRYGSVSIANTLPSSLTS